MGASIHHCCAGRQSPSHKTKRKENQLKALCVQLMISSQQFHQEIEAWGLAVYRLPWAKHFLTALQIIILVLDTFLL
jgi:hypothetical protein